MARAIHEAAVHCHYHLAREDCIVSFVFSNGEPVGPVYKVSQTKTTSQLQNHDLGSFPSDTDWHCPLILHMRSLLGGGSTQRKRSHSRSKECKKEKRAKYHGRHNVGAAL